MATSPVVFEQIVQQVQQLPPDEQLRLITRVAGQLAGIVRARPTQRLVYGKFHGDRLSTEEDFVIAEWRPTDDEIDGN